MREGVQNACGLLGETRAWIPKETSTTPMPLCLSLRTWWEHMELPHCSHLQQNVNPKVNILRVSTFMHVLDIQPFKYAGNVQSFLENDLMLEIIKESGGYFKHLIICFRCLSVVFLALTLR